MPWGVKGTTLPKFTHLSWNNTHLMTTRNERNLEWFGCGRRWEDSSRGRGHMYAYGWFMLMYGRNMFYNIYSIVKLHIFNGYSKTVILQLFFFLKATWKRKAPGPASTWDISEGSSQLQRSLVGYTNTMAGTVLQFSSLSTIMLPSDASHRCYAWGIPQTPSAQKSLTQSVPRQPTLRCLLCWKRTTGTEIWSSDSLLYWRNECEQKSWQFFTQAEQLH